MLDYLFAVPYYKSNIDSSLYNKTKLIEDITHNYNINPRRNHWDGGVSDIHHSYNDAENTNFIKINYDTVIPLYKKHVEKFCNQYFDTQIKYNFYIVNYTCFGKGQHMRVHNHPESSFTAIHYLKFDFREHSQTMYWSPLEWAFYTESFFSKPMRNAHTSNNINYSWFQENYKIGVMEDDIVITPSCLRHSVPLSYSDELRMAIIFNINITE